MYEYFVIMQTRISSNINISPRSLLFQIDWQLFRLAIVRMRMHNSWTSAGWRGVLIPIMLYCRVLICDLSNKALSEFASATPPPNTPLLLAD